MALRSSHFPRIVNTHLLFGVPFLFVLVSSSAAQTAHGCNVTADCGPLGATCSNKQCACITNYFSPSGTNLDCRSTSAPDTQCKSFDLQCVYCGSLFSGPCWLCGSNYYLLNEKCVASCSNVGFSYQPVPNTTLFAKTCLSSGSGSMSLPTWAIILIAILSVAFIVVLGSIVVAACFVWYRSYNAESFPVGQPVPTPLPPISPASRFTSRDQQQGIPLVPTAAAVVTRGLPPVDALEDINIMTSPDDDEEAIFLGKLDHLRHKAVNFLDILNDIRKRMKSLPQESATASHYKSVCQDLMRLLYLLNKKPSSVVMPPDGVQLLTWAERVLEKYPKISPRKSQQSTSRLSRIGEQDETDF